MTEETALDKARAIVKAVLSRPPSDARVLIAIAGPPAVGKTTVAGLVQAQLSAAGHPTAYLPMDGFHMDNAQLEPMGLLHRKGAPETFDLAAFSATLKALRGQGDLRVPLFDRVLDRVLPEAAKISAEQRHVVVEGNYLLFDAPGWRDLAAEWDFSVFVSEEISVLHERLLERWRDHGLSKAEGLARATENDLPNAEAVLAQRLEPDLNL